MSRIRTGPSPAPPSGDGPSLALPRGLPRGWEGVRARLGRAARDTMVGALIAVGALASVVLFVTTTYFTILCLIGIGFLALPHLTTAVRRVCDLNRRAAARSGVPVERPYRPEPEEIERDIVGWVRRCKWILADPASWRDLLWLLLNSVVGLLLGCAPAALLYYAGEGLALACGLWRPVAADGVGRWYAFITVDSWPAALAAGLAACAVFAGWLLLCPWLLKGYAYFVLFLLGPTQRARLASRVRHLAETRSGALDIQAAELRRIERDLHDGAQARLVSLGLTLGAVDRQLDRDAEEARRLLHDARSSSVQALRELRGLVRGIHPPVLAERGLADAVRALGLASPLPVTVTADLPGKLPDPVESAVYFSVSELLTNALKHADARQVEVVLRYADGALRGQVTDDGRGGAEMSAGSGLEGIRRRLASFDGVLEINSPPGGPTVVKMELPCALSSPKTSSS
ncbi:signal transduction histidine kinase [Streptomyces sp. DvalAA-21]|nr:integral membrane sensor signal transduction histidine kinase [Streptomyces sp. SirexAA-E]PZX34859.1 signal transduction histidine kinase [Streptomyces sp. DvalAA-21]RAJ40908.1 signal transduction histidine kinase [Streptomyces sp. DpondAA-E10]RAJ44016.1 signal transduction histidine kinase [Streptomyces sp. DpondAA-A50]SCE51556.1 Signal transduction histidine kinase [Streptomyces sp. DpondAA-F4a]SCL88430.1 Signal transduction histidine kinase [Streptomyces sp. DpondAA-F4]